METQWGASVCRLHGDCFLGPSERAARSVLSEEPS